MTRMGTRRAAFAGSWYTDDPEELDQDITTWLQTASSDKQAEGTHPVKAIIAPHAGLHYSGPTAAYAYENIDVSTIDRVFLLGPSHHAPIRQIALPASTTYATPLGDLIVDEKTIAELEANEKVAFGRLSRAQEEGEHSLEMHLPFIQKIFARKGKDLKLVPLMVGHLSAAQCQQYGTLFAPYLQDPHTLFVISSDFCHYGTRFGFTLEPKKGQLLWEAIKELDESGMAIIEKQQTLRAWLTYLDETENTVCGRMPIAVLLATFEASKDKAWDVRFVRYDQSSKCMQKRDSSVSYASAIAS